MVNLVDQVLRYDLNAHVRFINAINRVDALWNYTPAANAVLSRISRVVSAFFAAMQVVFWGLFEPLVNRVLVDRRRWQLLSQMQADIHACGHSAGMMDIAAKIDEIIRKEHLDFGDGNDVAHDIAQAVYATTYSQYAPVVVEWVQSLLARATKDNIHLVFIARDGLPVFHCANILKGQPPTVQTSCVYLSRDIVRRGSQEALRGYLQDQQFVREAIDQHKKLLFVDIGFYGTTIPRIRKALQKLGVPSDPKSPDNQVDFEFLICTSDRAHGFAGNLSSILPSVESAGWNRAVYWMEDTHQGVIESPSKLVKDEAGRYVPNTLKSGETCKSRCALDFLCKRVAEIAIEDRVRASSGSPQVGEPGCQQLKEEMRQEFDAVLHEWKSRRFVYVNHLVKPNIPFVRWIM
jgi:hypothetical protein